jgi:hypothetical protein
VVVNEIFDMLGHGYAFDVATGLDFGDDIAGNVL